MNIYYNLEKRMKRLSNVKNMFAIPKQMNIIMLQNKLLTFYFELKLQVRRMENISLTEICRLLTSCCAVVISTPIMGRIRASCQP